MEVFFNDVGITDLTDPITIVICWHFNAKKNVKKYFLDNKLHFDLKLIILKYFFLII